MDDVLLFCLLVSLVYALVVLLFGFDRWFGLVFRFGWLLYCLLLVFVFDFWFGYCVCLDLC